MKILPLFLILISTSAFGQNFLQRHILWDTPIEKAGEVEFQQLIHFQGAYYEDFQSVFPLFFEKLPVEKALESARLSLFRVVTARIPFESVPETFRRELTTDFLLMYDLSKESGDQFIQYRIFPFRLGKDGNVERLVSFILQLDITEKEGEALESRRKALLAEDSPLANGDWYKVRISQDGIHKITYSELASLGLTDPSSVRIYGWGGRRLPEDYTKGMQDEFIQVPVYMNKGQDGLFNGNDYLLFYAQGTVEWSFSESGNMFVHEKNPYSDYGYYYITSGNSAPSSPEIMETPPGESDFIVNDYNALYYYENDEINLIESGKEWYGELFDITTQRTFSFEIPGLINSSDVLLKTNLLGRAKDTNSFNVYANNKLLDTAFIRSTNLSDYTATYAFNNSEIYAFRVDNEKIDIRLKFNKPDASAKGWLDYLALNAQADLRLRTNQLIFRNKISRLASVAEFHLSGASTKTQVWDVTEYPDVRLVQGDLAGDVYTFKVEGGVIHEFVAFNTDGTFPSVDFSAPGLGKIDNQNLKGNGHPDLVIISYKDFLPYAEELASYRRQINDIEVVIATPEEVYNEFSSGRPDITAIRNYLSFLYNTAGEDPTLRPRYLLLFGDGSYNFKNTDPLNGNFVPAYQSDNSLSPVSSFVTDDFFGLLDPGESISTGLLDIGIGRLPVSNTIEAERMVQKIIRYESPEQMGEWRNTIAFIGDDEDNNIHFTQADQLARYVEDNYPSFNVNKIYLDAYPQVTTPVGQRYPAVNAAINNQVNKGALIINYTGHGGTKGLAHEQVLGLNDIQSWENNWKLPLFMTATCEFSRFDKPDIVSAGEQVILSDKGGGIALFTTTRLVYSGPNHILNEKFYEVVFEKNEEGKNYCLGDIMQYSKNNAGFGINKRNFTLLGDPAMRLTYPFYHIIADSINNSPVEHVTDTLRALTEVTISGYVQDIEGKILPNYSGIIYPTVFDKASVQNTLANDGGQSKSFNVRNNIIYKGKATVKKGRFSFSFVVPKDINYAFGLGKISFYASDSLLDASGSFQDFVVGGSASLVNSDSNGPEIEVFMNNSHFRNGGITDENPVLFVKVTDDNGINTTGNGIGHDITAVLNGNTQNTLVLNEYYQSELDSYKSGSLSYPLYNLDEGHHEIQVKMWDIYNNSATGSVEFIVVKSEEMLLENLMNYPNPFSESTLISFEHNKSDQDLDIIIDIFDMEGSLVRTIKAKEFGAGYRSQPIFWDGKGEAGNQNRQGNFIYRIRVKSSDGSEAVRSGRLIILR